MVCIWQGSFVYALRCVNRVLSLRCWWRCLLTTTRHADTDQDQHTVKFSSPSSPHHHLNRLHLRSAKQNKTPRVWWPYSAPSLYMSNPYVVYQKNKHSHNNDDGLKKMVYRLIHNFSFPHCFMYYLYIIYIHESQSSLIGKKDKTWGQKTSDFFIKKIFNKDNPLLKQCKILSDNFAFGFRIPIMVKITKGLILPRNFGEISGTLSWGFL